MAKKPRIGLYRESTAKSVLEKLGKTERKNTNLSSKVGVIPAEEDTPYFIIAKITAEVSDGYYTMQEQVWDDTAVNKVDHAWADSADTVTFEAKEVAGTTEIEVGGVYRCWYEVTKDGHTYLFQLGGGSSDIVYIEITASTNISTYTGTIYDNPITRTLVESGVTVRALQHDAGTIPNSDSGEGFWCIYDKDNSVYHIMNYSIFYG